MESSGLPAKKHGTRLRASDRAQAARVLLDRYNRGESIRELAVDSGYSIGLVRNLLIEADVAFRPKGGRARA